MDTADSPDVVIAKRLLDQVKQAGFIFQRVASGEDAPLVGYRVSDGWVDLIHIEGFSRDCFAWRQRVSSLVVSHDTLVQRMAEGSALDVPKGAFFNCCCAHSSGVGIITFSLLFGFLVRFLVVASPLPVVRRVVGALVGAVTAGVAGDHLLAVGASWGSAW